jgi:hypothetical protein
MTDTTASFHYVTSLDGRIHPLGEGSRAIQLCLNGVVNGLGTTAAVCATVTVVAVSIIINTALATGPNSHATAPIGPEAVALTNHYPTVAGPVNFSNSARVSTDSADAVTFETRWPRATAPVSSSAVPLISEHPVEPASNVARPQPNPWHPPQSQAKPEPADAPDSTDVVQLTPAAAPESARPITLTLLPKLIPEWANSIDSDSHTAVYDIAAHTVYMPNGDRLEAHSGAGNKLDDSRYVSVKDLGPTPPNVYDLALREQLFHGVRVLRLNPVGGGNMFGRDGMLAHPYMRDANGQSNGCVSIKDYPAFLNAYLRDEINRLVVVSNLGNTSWRTVSALQVPAHRYAENNP